MWKICLKGSNEYIAPDASGCVSLEALGTSNPMTDDSWLKADVLGMGAKRSEREPDERIGGVVHRGTGLRVFDCEIAPYRFPADMHKLDELYSHLSKRFVYLHKGNYNFANFAIHPDGKALAVAASVVVEDDYDGGRKQVKIRFKVVR